MAIRTRWAVSVVAAAAALLAATPAYASASKSADPTTVTVRADQPGAMLTPGAVGVNTPIWNGHLLDPRTAGLVRQAGVGMLEFNGGGVSDLYHWRDGSLSPDPDPAGHPYDYDSLTPAFSFDQFERTAQATGATTMVHVNYGTGTPQEAAAWVRYANLVKHYGVRDWAIGEEVWGNGGIDGIDFEPDGHADKSPTAYARNVVAYARAMKAVDPSIRIGVEVTGVASGPLRQWDSTVLAIAGPVVDFVDFHYYPFGATDTSDAGLLALTRQIPANVAALRRLVDADSGPAGHHVDLVAGETNSAVAVAPQQVSMFNALYLADNDLTLLDNGVRDVAWWALYNGGTASAGDLGLLSSGICDSSGGDCQPAAGTPFPPYFGLRLVGAVARPGGRMLPVASGNSLVRGHAVREADGSLAVLLANDDPDNAAPVRLDLRGYRAEGSVAVLGYRQGDSGIRTGRWSDPNGVLTLPPYSITVLRLNRRG